MHTTTLSRNLEIAIPPALCDVLAFTPGQAVDLTVKDGCLVISPLPAPTQFTATQPPPPRPCGLNKGEFTVPEDFNAPLFETPE